MYLCAAVAIKVCGRAQELNGRCASSSYSATCGAVPGRSNIPQQGVTAVIDSLAKIKSTNHSAHRGRCRPVQVFTPTLIPNEFAWRVHFCMPDSRGCQRRPFSEPPQSLKAATAAIPLSDRVLASEVGLWSTALSAQTIRHTVGLAVGLELTSSAPDCYGSCTCQRCKQCARSRHVRADGSAGVGNEAAEAG